MQTDYNLIVGIVGIVIGAALGALFTWWEKTLGDVLYIFTFEKRKKEKGAPLGGRSFLFGAPLGGRSFLFD